MTYRITYKLQLKIIPLLLKFENVALVHYKEFPASSVMYIFKMVALHSLILGRNILYHQISSRSN